MNFRTKYDEAKNFYSNPGERYKVEYQLDFNDDGSTKFVEVGKTDTFAEIQSHKESVEISTLISRYLAGDTGALERVQGFYGDVSKMPNDVVGFMRLQAQGKNIFDNLPADVKSLYNNSYEQFLVDPSIALNVNQEIDDIKSVTSDAVIDDPKPKEEVA